MIKIHELRFELIDHPSLCHPPPARHRAARRALVTPTYSPLLANTPSELLVVFSF
ncbi:hypothetical protein ALC60_09676 [Trachymyrmex zeteki]|uniref:Uncharacterized protein n=1 Tax=Mycetomoellerius zeteki TaxID=64791 RepID=A0A151WTY9_9HYME|nr:hypothetical protein ALC60_09676 [Trachymyrmex zeteki]